MPLNPALIYRRTDRGLREVYEKSHQFTQSERLVLILLDGRLSVGALHARLPSLDGDRIERTLAKLVDAGLIEPLDMADPDLQSPSRAEEVLLLEPEVVAEFLEQAELDPLTSPGRRQSGDTEAASSTATAPRTTTGRATTSSGGGGSGASGHSHFLPPNDDDWNPTEATAFAITTVNVPDRLDMQEERDRVEAEGYEAQRRRAQIGQWMKRLLGAVVVVVIIAVGYAVLKPLLDAASPVQIGTRLSGAFQRPVTVASTEFRFTPSPRLVLRGIDVGGEFAASEAALLINWLDFWRAINGGQWAWGEARIAPLTLSPDQAAAAVRLLPQAAGRFPRSIAAVRVESVRVEGSRLFPGTYEAAFRRGADGILGPLIVRSEQGEDGAIQAEFRPSPSEAGVVDFGVQARAWSMPLAMQTRWEDLRATGSLRANAIELTAFAVRGYYGITTGALTFTRGAEWVLSGKADAANIDVETVLNSVGRERATARPAEGRPAALQGTANLSLLVAGRGPTLEEAIARAAVAGPFTVRSAVLNGINLGMVATQGTASAGATRFMEFGGTVAASRAGVRFEDAGGKAGAMVARANFSVGDGGAIAGSMRVELGGQRVQAPINLRISGSVAEPRFGR